jgi:signal transduction histidine kinase
MRNLPGAVGVSLLLALLTWLLLRGIDTDAPAYVATLQAFDDYALAEASLHRDVLQARAGLLRDYDSLVGAAQAMEDAVARLRSHARAQRLDEGVVDRLSATVVQQNELMERFKTNNALLQNSLSYVGLMSTNSAFLARDAKLAPATGALAAAILYLSRDNSSDALRAFNQRIEEFAEQAPSVGPDAQVAAAMLSHARLLYDLLPAVDETLRAFIAVAGEQPLRETRALFSDHRTRVEAVEQRYRLLLYMVSLLTVLMIVLLGLRLRSRAIALRRRAAFEHVIAENSTRLINCSPAETASRLKQVLGEFSRMIGAQRAYVVLGEKPIRVYTWSRDGKAFPPGWPHQALTLAQQLGVAETESVTIPDVAALQPSPVRDALTAAGVRAWASVPLIRPGRARSIMGFDAFRPIRGKVSPVPIVRLAGDAVANAIEREFLERDRAKLTMRLERARRMQMVGTLASGIAHNFNNIIAAILGYSEMVEPQLAPGSRSAQHVDEIRRAAERGRDLVDNILTFGRRTDAPARAVRMRNLLEEAASFLRASLPSGAELVFDDVSSDLAVSGEPTQLQQVILNLCANAAQAMDGKGDIYVGARLEEVADFLQIGDTELSPGRYVCLSVSDSGRGFDAHIAQRMFEPFFTTRVAGTGLGLATVREIVRDHDGAIGVQSRPGHGSRFEIWLPAMVAGGVAIDEPALLPLGRGQTILIVESERGRLLQDEERLAALGYEPVGFEHSADALVACRSEPDRFDVILVSCGSQTHVGMELARSLSEIGRFKPILLAAASSIEVSVDALAEAGISEVLRWPLASNELAAALARCLRRPSTLRL